MNKLGSALSPRPSSLVQIYRIYFLLQDYPSYLAQAVYASFCESFPDSYRQFDDAFKEMIIVVTSQWIVGKCDLI